MPSDPHALINCWCGHDHTATAGSDHEMTEDEKAEDIITMALALHDAGIRCSPNIPHCRASHTGHAVRLLNALDAIKEDEKSPVMGTSSYTALDAIKEDEK